MTAAVSSERLGMHFNFLNQFHNEDGDNIFLRNFETKTLHYKIQNPRRQSSLFRISYHEVRFITKLGRFSFLNNLMVNTPKRNTNTLLSHSTVEQDRSVAKYNTCRWLHCRANKKLQLLQQLLFCLVEWPGVVEWRRPLGLRRGVAISSRCTSLTDWFFTDDNLLAPPPPPKPLLRSPHKLHQ
jgi:hypothetical protein